MSAYDHSFLPSATGAYILRMVNSGWDFEAAQNQARIEHGVEQVDEIVTLVHETIAYRGWQPGFSSVPALRLAIRRAEAIEAERQL